MQALLAARNSAGVVFMGTFGALAYVLFHGDLDVLAVKFLLSWSFFMIARHAYEASNYGENI